jgi:predicted N-acyltransferase
MTFHQSISEIDETQWNALLAHSDCAVFFQTRECYDFYNSLTFLQSFAFGISESDDLQAVAIGYVEKNGGKILQNFTKRAIIQGGILIANNISESVLTCFLNKLIKEISEKAIFLEIRNFNDYSKYKNIFEKSGLEYVQHFNIQIDTNDKNAVWGNLSKSKRRQIRVGQRNGVQTVELKTADEITNFYHCLKKLYKTRVGTPLFPLEFFLKLAKIPSGKIFAAKYDSKIIGGIVCAIFSQRCVYEWFICGEDKMFRAQFPSVTATWAGINFALENNIAKFDFMGAGEPNMAYGVRDFKTRFGGKQVEYGRFLYVSEKNKYKIGTFGVKFLKILKSIKK